MEQGDGIHATQGINFLPSTQPVATRFPASAPPSCIAQVNDSDLAAVKVKTHFSSERNCSLPLFPPSRQLWRLWINKYEVMQQAEYVDVLRFRLWIRNWTPVFQRSRILKGASGPDQHRSRSRILLYFSRILLHFGCCRSS